MINSFFLVDTYQFWINAITIIIIVLSVLASHNDFFNWKTKFMLLMIWIMSLIVIQIFIACNYLLFYVFFELSVIPIFYLIIGWGYQPERIYASYSIFFYTIISSAPLISLLIFINWIIKKSHFSEFVFSPEILAERSQISCIFLMVFLGFFVKLPIYSLHLWLPKAHVEAPVYGSMLLAGILLKLAGIGIIRFGFILKSEFILIIVIVISIIGMTLVSLNCLKLTDLKMVIALSSVAHISFVLLNAIIFFKLGNKLSFFVILSHAFRSRGIFYIAFLFYIVSHSRNIILNKGILSYFPKLSLIWIIILIASIGTPPTVNCVSEVFSIILLVNLVNPFIILLILRFIFSSAFRLILYRSSQQESLSLDVCKDSSYYPITLLISFFHRFLVLSLVLTLNIFL